MELRITLFLINTLQYTCGQYAVTNRKPLISSCDGPGKNTLVEQFFNTIFSEFHNTPPICVCVQMCPDQSSYCYPNGCLKKDDGVAKAKNADFVQTVAHIQNVNVKPFTMLVEDKNDFMMDFLKNNYVDDSSTVQTERSTMQKMRPDPFKDKYKMLYKYKKMPKVELRYNLREQVKNMKSDHFKIETIDVSKTRWPLKKHNKIQGTNSEAQQRKPAINSRYFQSTLVESVPAEYPPKYFKREVKKKLDDVKIKAVYLQDISDPASNTSFSLESLIDKLIENSFETNKAELDSQIVLNNSKGNESKILVPTENVYENSTSLANETTNVISINSGNENVDKNKYIDESNTNYIDAFDEIKSLSKRIEKQNNTSLEILKRVVSINATLENQPTTILPTEAEKNTKGTAVPPLTVEEAGRENTHTKRINITSENQPATIFYTDQEAEKNTEALAATPLVVKEASRDVTRQTSTEAQITPTSTDYSDVITTKKNRQIIRRKFRNAKLIKTFQ